MRVAIVVDWLTDAGGGEAVLGEALRTFPGSSVHALLDQMSDAEHARLGIPRAHVSWLQVFVGRTGNYRRWLPLMPAAAHSLTPREADVVLAISHAVAQQVRVQPGQKLLCLSLSPMRYAWDLREQYLAEVGLDRGVKGLVTGVLLDRMQATDRAASKQVRAYAAISHHIADRVRRAYGRESEVIYPPVDTEFYTPGAGGHAGEGPYFVTASRFVPYKRMDLIVRAFVGMPERKLVVIGDGPDREKVRAAAGVAGRPAPNVTFTGHLGREELRGWLRGARAFVFAAEEDFGIAPLEAQACGIPVIAYGKGGVLETVAAAANGAPAGGLPPTGLFFVAQSESAIQDAVGRFEANAGWFTAAVCRASAERFAAARFRESLRTWVEAEG